MKLVLAVKLEVVMPLDHVGCEPVAPMNYSARMHKEPVLQASVRVAVPAVYMAVKVMLPLVLQVAIFAAASPSYHAAVLVAAANSTAESLRH